MRKFIILDIENEIQLDKYIYKKINANKAFVSIMLRKKQIKINGVHPKNANLYLKSGDEVIFYINDESFKKETEFKPNYNIIYEDKNIIIIDKDKGMLVHSNNHHDLVSMVNKYLSNKFESNASPVNRLDQFTEGLIIFSKNNKTTSILSKLIEDKSIKKYYKAIVKGKMEKNTDILHNYYSFNDKTLTATIYNKKEDNTKEIITEYKEINTNNVFTLLEINLLTGRTHQIRAHLSYINHPILGDNKYGDKTLNMRYNISSQELLSYKIEFRADIKGELAYLSNKIFISKKDMKLPGDL